MKIISLFCFGLILVCSVVSPVCACEEESPYQEGESVPATALFTLEGLQPGLHTVVGRLSLRRQFLGTRATPSYQDLVQFYCFNGDLLRFLSFQDPALESELVKLLATGESMPAVLSVRCELKRVGHDGINVSDRLVAKVEKYRATSFESVAVAARKADQEARALERYQQELTPSWEKDGLTVSMGEVLVRSQAVMNTLSVHGLRVFNTTAKAVKVELVGLAVEQAGQVRDCTWSKGRRRSANVVAWEVPAEDWSDGAYLVGQSPQVLWTFDVPPSVNLEKGLKVFLKLKLNQSEEVTLTQTVGE